MLGGTKLQQLYCTSRVHVGGEQSYSNYTVLAGYTLGGEQSYSNYTVLAGYTLGGTKLQQLYCTSRVHVGGNKVTATILY